MITESGFIMTNLTKLLSKVDQLEVLLTFRQQASKSYKELCKQNDTMTNILRKLNP